MLPAALRLIVGALLSAGLNELAAAVIAKWKATGDVEAAAAEAEGHGTVGPQPPKVGRMQRRDDFWDEWGNDPLVQECRLDLLLRRCE